MSAQRGEWRTLFKAFQPVDPDYPSPPSSISLWLDNLGGLMLGMDLHEGEKRIILPLSDDEARDRAFALATRNAVDS